MTDCSICCEKFNKVNRKKVTCAFCDFDVCRACVQQYMLGTVNDPHCMKCKNAWNREFVDTACSKTFCTKELKVHRENVLFEREKCLMPDTQPHVAQILRTRETIQLLAAAQAELIRQRAHVAWLETMVMDMRTGRVGPAIDQDEKRVFVRKCPCDGCRGFLSSKWKCGVCEKKICPECNEEKGEGHVCDQNNVETVKLLKTDTKSCPKCGTMIFKISGCSQMWCPDCHTAFDWNTMRIETGIIHNPHYYDFQRANAGAMPAGRNLGDIPCGGFPSYNEMRLAQTGAIFSTDNYNKIIDVHRLIAHVQQFELRYTYRDAELPVNNTDIRTKYLMNEISEKDFKITAQKREKAREKSKDLMNILRMYSDTGSDLMRQSIQHDRDIRVDYVEILMHLREYTNNTFEKIHKRYNCVTPYINRKHELVSEKWLPPVAP